MSGESDIHKRLVHHLAQYVRERHDTDGNLALFFDGNATGGERPRRIEGHLPDLSAFDVPKTFTIIGEAKTTRDIETVRSQRQIRTFMDHLALQKRSFFYLAVPFFLQPRAHHVLQCCRDERHRTVESTVLYFSAAE